MGQYIQDFNLISLSQEDVETTGNIEDPIITIGPKNLLRIIDQVSNKVFIEYLSNLQ